MEVQRNTDGDTPCMDILPKEKKKQVQNCCKMQQEIMHGEKKRMNRRFCVYVPSFRICALKTVVN